MDVATLPVVSMESEKHSVVAVVFLLTEGWTNRKPFFVKRTVNGQAICLLVKVSKSIHASFRSHLAVTHAHVQVNVIMHAHA